MLSKTEKSVRSGKKPGKDGSTQRYLPFSEIRENMILMKDNSSRMILKVHALNFNLKSTEEQDAILMSYQRFLNALNFPIQLIVRSLRVDIEAYINKLKILSDKQQNTLLKNQTDRYIDFLLTLIDVAQIMKKEFYIVVPYDQEGNESVRKNGITGIFTSFWRSISQEESVSDIIANRRMANRLYKGNMERLSTVKMSLEAIGLRAEELSKEELVKFLYNYYNPRTGNETLLKTNPDNLDLG